MMQNSIYIYIYIYIYIFVMWYEITLINNKNNTIELLLFFFLNMTLQQKNVSHSCAVTRPCRFSCLIH